MNDENEIWKVIDGFNNYEVSNTGKVRSLNYLGHGKIKEMTSNKDAKGYLRVHFHKDGVDFQKRVHRLVAEAFINNPDKKPQVNHIDGNKQNNRVENLEWTTARDNILHAYASGLKENNRHFSRVLGSTIGKRALEKARELQKTPVYATNLKTGEITKYASQKEAAEMTGAQQANIYKVLVGQRKSTLGYSFAYAERSDVSCLRY